MTNRKIRLVVPSAMKDYAKLHGAQYSKSEGWYFSGGIVPIELEDFQPKAVKPREQITTWCPICGGQMVLRQSKIGNVFWGCMVYPRCHGSRSVDEEIVDVRTTSSALKSRGLVNIMELVDIKKPRKQPR